MMPVAARLRREDVVRFMRVVEPDERLDAVKMVPMAGNTLLKIGSLAAVEAYLKPIGAQEVAGLDTNMRIHYVAPAVLASWVRDTIGDSGLAGGLDGIIAGRRAYGVLVPEMKQLIAERIAEYRTVLGEHEQEPEQ